VALLLHAAVADDIQPTKVFGFPGGDAWRQIGEE
jgi:hypothetical protein